MRQRSAAPDAALPLVLVILLTIGVTALILSSQLLDISLPRNLVPAYHPAAQERPVDGAAPVAKLSLDAPTQSVAVAPPGPAEAGSPDAIAEGVTPPPVPSELAVGARARVANTDNLGVVFYAAPRDNARQPAGLLEGTAVTVLERSGDEWARVQSDSKKSGWVRAQYLVSAE